jgi:hypothetical protein
MQLLAMDLGVTPGLAPLSQAVQQFPGGAVGPVTEGFTADQTKARIARQYLNGDERMLDAELDRARINEVLPSVGVNPVTVRDARALVQRTGVIVPSAAPAAPAPTTDQIVNQFTQRLPAPRAAPSVSQLPATIPSSVVELPGKMPSSGVWLGAQTLQPSSAPGVNVFTPSTFGDDLLNQLSQLTGLPVDQLRRVLPTNLIAGQYTPQQLAESPVVKAMQQGTMPARFRAAPVAPNERFGNISALGIPMGLRGGQDFNLQAYLQGGPVNRQIMEGAVKAMGFDPNTFLWQATKTAPMTDLTPGLRGRRAF